ncbi:MAG: SDR family oxidoreductase [Bacteroidales bacterium]|nr:SDR family oxidoreductase [Bacteroidales bacterium]
MENKKVVLVTGTSSGFGDYIVKTLALAGYHTVATMRNIDGKNRQAAANLKNWAAKENTNVTVIEMDVTSDASVENAVKEMLVKEGQIDVIVNNAGVAAMGYAEAYSNEQLQQLFGVNVIGSNRVIKACLPKMRIQKSGLVIQISSLAASLPMPYHGNYPATKLAIETIIESYKFEMMPFGIDFIIVQPGGFPTSLIDNAMKPVQEKVLGEYGELAGIPEKIFAALADALSGPNAPSPQAIADAVKELIEMPMGARPLRTIVDKMGFEAVTSAAESINKHNEQTRLGLMKAMGFGQ